MGEVSEEAAVQDDLLFSARPGFVAREQRAGKPPEGWRWTSGFDWRLVDSTVISAMLSSAGTAAEATLADLRGDIEQQLADAENQLTEDEEQDEPPDPQDIEREVLLRTAEKVFGDKPRYRSILDCRHALLNTWVGQMKGQRLEALASAVQRGVSGDARREVLRTDAQRRRFLRERNHTKNFVQLLHKGFLDAHQGSWWTRKQTSLEAIPAVLPLTGEDGDRAYEPYEHSVKAWAKLNGLRTKGAIRGLVVLPTGAGKTDVAVGWLLDRLNAEPELRVLWLAHQISLLEQAAARFALAAHLQPKGFDRTLRIFSSRHSTMSLFDRDHTDVACATIQTVSRGIDRWRKGRHRRQEVRKFLTGPTVVVIDEAHHVGGPGYQRLLERFIAAEAGHDLIGLTATPWGADDTMQQRIDRTFPTEIIRYTRDELIAAGVLADFRVLAVRTHFEVHLDEGERRAAAREGDLPNSVLGRLNDDQRTAAVCKTYLDQAERWGRTLIFAPSTDNADAIGDALKQAERGAQVRVLHHRSGKTVTSLKKWFKQTERAVIVSVGMLLEGVDLPSAQTALLARPTTNSTLLTQMVGRVLRGPQAGGGSLAEIVYFQDEWPDFNAVLTPDEPQHRTGPPPPPIGDGEPPHVPPAFRADVADEVVKALEAAISDATAPPSGPAEEGQEHEEQDQQPAGWDVRLQLEQRRIVGYFVVDDERTVPVFDHQLEPLESWIERRKARRDAELRWSQDLPEPRPTKWHLRQLSQFVDEHRRAPEFHPLARSVAPIEIARRLIDDTSRTREQELELLRAAHEDALTKRALGSFEHFCEEVDRWKRLLVRPPVPERELPQRPGRPPLARQPRRRLDGPWQLVKDRLHRLPAVRRALVVEPELVWSDTVVSYYLAKWQAFSPQHQRITINKLLQSTTEHVSDEMLGYLIWHEVVHMVTPGAGHSADFYALEQRWPNAVALDTALDALVDTFSCNAADYGGKVSTRKPRDGAQRLQR